MDADRTSPVLTVWVVDLAPGRAEAETIDHPAWLDPIEQTDAARRRRPVDRAGYVAAHLAMRRVLGTRLGEDPGAVRLGRLPCPVCAGPHGRPFLPDHPRLGLSLSRSGGFAAIALAPHAVGVDIESLPPTVRAEDLAAALHPTEAVALATVPAIDRDRVALGAWARKEALLKGWGTGLAVDPTAVAVGRGSPADPRGDRGTVRLAPQTVTVTEPGGAARRLHQGAWTVVDVEVGAPVVVAVAHPTRPDGTDAAPIQVVETTLAVLLADAVAPA